MKGRKGLTIARNDITTYPDTQPLDEDDFPSHYIPTQHNISYNTPDFSFESEEIPQRRKSPISLANMKGVFLVTQVDPHVGKFVKNKLSGWYYPHDGDLATPMRITGVYSNKITDFWLGKEDTKCFIIVKKYRDWKDISPKDQDKFNRDGGIRLKFKNQTAIDSLIDDFKNNIIIPSHFNVVDIFGKYF